MQDFFIHDLPSYKEDSKLTRIAAYIYRNLNALHNVLYDKHIFSSKQLTGKVISIGNIQFGGTGKSPVVMKIAQFLQQRGFSVAVLTRGYKSGLSSDDSCVFINGELNIKPINHSLDIYADEARMQSNHLKNIPIIVGAKRFKAVERYLTTSYQLARPEVWILDDGFQHRKIQRDLDIVLVDHQNFFNTKINFRPSLLRENISSLTRADSIILTSKEDAELPNSAIEQIQKLIDAPIYQVLLLTHRPICVVGGDDYSRIKNWYAVAAIAKPEHFIKSLKKWNLQIKSSYFLFDHQCFNYETVIDTVSQCDGIITTEKDFWRDPELFKKLSKPVFVLPLYVDISDKTLEQMLTKILK